MPEFLENYLNSISEDFEDIPALFGIGCYIFLFIWFCGWVLGMWHL